jgi:hypothetical protein
MCLLPRGAIVLLDSKANEERKEAMLARFDHRPMLTAALALTTAVLVVVAITLATLLITSAPAVNPTSVNGGNPGAGAANPAERMDAGGKGYGMPVKAPANPAERMDAGGKGYGMPIEEPAQKGDSVAPHQEIPSAHYGL